MKKRKKLNYRFHDPNPPGVAAEYILKVLIETNMPKVERAIHEAEKRAAGLCESENKVETV